MAMANNATPLTLAQLSEIVSRFGHSRIAVLGDFFLDKYLDIEPGLQEVSVETGLPAHQVVGIRSSPGAAGTVVGNLSALGAGKLHAIGWIGDDGEGFELTRGLKHLGCSTEHLHVVDTVHTPTYLKPRDVHTPGLAGEHPRYDTKNRVPATATLAQRVIRSLNAIIDDLDAVIVLDQVEDEGGVVSPQVREHVIELARSRPQILFWADSRSHLRHFRHMLIKPNQFEVLELRQPPPGTRVDEQQLTEAARRLRERNQAPVVVTRGDCGMLVSDPDWRLVPAVHVDGPIDTTGAGDSATAGAVLAICGGASLEQAALIGNLVASLTIQQLGTTGVTSPEALPARLEMWRSQNEDR